ncbi:expansin-A7 [Selaginella moellendorffii]|nr:expansin-A7 [Selaginella moellendorffii]|eukprot:XP_002966951.2 expansin-A7 [Selaginella moellendorffii]
MMRSVIACLLLCATLLVSVDHGRAASPKSLKKRATNAAKDIYNAGGWKQAFATFYGDETARETMGGACGYGNLYQSGYGLMTAALSSTLFNSGYGCGQCYEITCTLSKHCYFGKSVVVTATNLCPPNWSKPSNNGGWCNPPRVHFDMSKPAFMKIAFWRAGIIPVSYRRVPCARSGGMNFKLSGNRWWLMVFITNVGGSGDIKAVSVKGSRTGWIAMTRNWGVGFQVFKQLQGQSLSFMVTCYSTGKTTVHNNVAPANWQLGSTYSAKQL